MALYITPWSIGSDVTPEIATCAATSGDFWVLSWLPGRVLTYEQAVSGMVLDEILSDPEPVDGDTALELAEIRAAELGLTLAEVVVRLAVRIAQRDEHRRSPGRRQAPVVRSHLRDARPRTRQ
ncbi:hypothetical protein JK358_27785 [Nocardia sp. 2]|uniref:Uncharacterized protein n=1 Tax=Nocardia acididurans TaxID=2802282 RepID=A0ABS1MC29_9NOCA|nr:hypothetical protein [Nocardia acididurans]MBL1078215.1 hypothetical protein [Nocardia acididurans]